MTVKHQLIIISTGPISYHPGADFYHDKNGVYAWQQRSTLIEC